MTADNDWDMAVAHLAARDTRLAALIALVGSCTLRSETRRSIFYALANSIIYQQLAGAAAAAIFARFENLFPRRQPTAVRLLELEDDVLRAAGLSQNKMRALRDLAAKCLDGTVPSPRRLDAMSDEAIVAQISQVRGVGRWTVEMLLIFRLGRPNVLPVDDYGIRKGAQRLYRLRALPDREALRRRARRWQPYCSIASWYLWRCSELPDDALSRLSARASRSAAKPTTASAVALL